MNTRDISILVVSRKESVRGFLTASLSFDYTCIAVEGVEEAMKQLRARFFNLIIIDIAMVNASGVELCKLIRKTSPETVVIGLSQLEGIQYVMEAMRQGTFEYIAEPFNLSEVSMSVEHALRHQARLGKLQVCLRPADLFNVPICESPSPKVRMSL